MKSVWGVAAGFLTLVFAVVLFIVVAAGLGSAARLSVNETADGIDVPRIGTVGDFPDPEHRIVVNVGADGRIVLDGRTYDCAELLDELRRRGLRSGRPLPGTRQNLSDEAVVLRVDGALAWGAAQRLLLACSEAMIWRIFFAVRHEGDGEEGALAVFLPRDHGGLGCEADASLVHRRVVVTAKDGRGTPAALHADLARSPASQTGRVVVTLDAAPEIATRTALALADASLRSGAASVEFAISVAGKPATLAEAYVSEARRPRDTRTSYAMRIVEGPFGEEFIDRDAPDDAPVGRELATDVPPAAMQAVARVRGAFAGVAK